MFPAIPNPTTTSDPLCESQSPRAIKFSKGTTCVYLGETALRKAT